MNMSSYSADEKMAYVEETALPSGKENDAYHQEVPNAYCGQLMPAYRSNLALAFKDLLKLACFCAMTVVGIMMISKATLSIKTLWGDVHFLYKQFPVTH